MMLLVYKFLRCNSYRSIVVMCKLCNRCLYYLTFWEYPGYCFMFRILYASITHLMVFNHLRIVVLLYNLPSLRFDFRTTEPSSYIIVTLKIFVCKILWFFFFFSLAFFMLGMKIISIMINVQRIYLELQIYHVLRIKRYVDI
jgi:hypothetical protein